MNTPRHRYRHALQGPSTAISVELALGAASGAADVAAQADMLRGRVDGVQVLDSPLAWTQMSVVAASSLLLQAGLDPLPMLTCRDRNRIGLLSDLLGLRALGVESVLLGRGRRVGKRHALHASTVFDMTGRELIAMAAGLGEDVPGGDLFIGTGAKAHRARAGWTADSLRARGEAGAQFLMTQLCFDVGLLRHWLDALVAARQTWRYSVVVSLAAFPSASTARWVRDNLRDSRIPDAIIQRLETADDPAEEGVAICAEAMREVAALPGVSGIHLMSTGNPELAVAAVKASGLRDPA